MIAPPEIAHAASPLLDVRDLTVRFSQPGQPRQVTIVDRVSLRIPPARTLGIVGESGCGKTTLARAILRLVPATGTVVLDGRDILTADSRTLRAIRPKMQMVFQDPYASLNPRHAIERIVGEGLVLHHPAPPAEHRERVADMLLRVGLSPDYLARYPHELSGGQRQRVAIARALILRPSVVICDEPVSALDVSIQSQILNLLIELQSQFGLSLLFIGHQLGVVRHVSHDIAVMYLGRIVESGPADVLFYQPRHPYTQALLAASLDSGGVDNASAELAVSIAAANRRSPRGRLPPVLPGEPPSAAHRPAGCAFHPRCPFAVDRCRLEPPDLLAAGKSSTRESRCVGRAPPGPDTPYLAPTSHHVACHRAGELHPQSMKEALAAREGGLSRPFE